MSNASEVKDADRGPHETWCDTQNAISKLCNCMASSYIDRIEDLESIIDRQARVIEKLREQRDNLIPAALAEYATPMQVSDYRESLEYDIKDIEKGEGT